MGACAGAVHEIKPAEAIVNEMVSGAAEVLGRLWSNTLIKSRL
jgi:hypothetical protein